MMTLLQLRTVASAIKSDPKIWTAFTIQYNTPCQLDSVKSPAFISVATIGINIIQIFYRFSVAALMIVIGSASALEAWR